MKLAYHPLVPRLCVQTALAVPAKTLGPQIRFTKYLKAGLTTNGHLRRLSQGSHQLRPSPKVRDPLIDELRARWARILCAIRQQFTKERKDWICFLAFCFLSQDELLQFLTAKTPPTTAASLAYRPGRT